MKMLITTSQTLPGHRIVETLGLVRGSAIRTRNVFADLAEWFRNLVGAELVDYTKMMAETREQALDRMADHARQLGGNAIIAVRFMSSSIAKGASEMLAYGTAVRVEPGADEPSG
jgi:uncharacterized protein YbjQ (UPF0145 family)